MRQVRNRVRSAYHTRVNVGPAVLVVLAILIVPVGVSTVIPRTVSVLLDYERPIKVLKASIEFITLLESRAPEVAYMSWIERTVSYWLAGYGILQFVAWASLWILLAILGVLLAMLVRR